jgi:outer membrane protein assembly factor BamB
MLPNRQVVFLLAQAIVVLVAATASAKDDSREALWAAIRNSDAKTAKALLGKGTDVNAKNEIGITALWIAVNKGKPEVIELLIEAGADVNARDGIWYETPLSIAVAEGHAEIVTALLRAGAKDIDAALVRAAVAGKLPVLRALLDNGKPRQEALDGALFAAPRDKKEIRETLEKTGAKAVKPAAAKDRDTWKQYAGTYESENGGKLTLDVLETGLAIVPSGAQHQVLPSGGSRQHLTSTGPDTFSPLGLEFARYTFERKAGSAYRVILKRYTGEVSYYRLDAHSVAKAVKPPREGENALVAAPLNWPSLRGPDGSGVADGQQPPLTWDVKTGSNVRWKTPIPGLGHSSPIVWGDRVFVSTALSADPDPKVRTGNYGDVDSVNDTSKHTWQVLCLDRNTGQILWTRTAFEGVPKIKRHLKGSQANCTPATDGKHVVACFGPEGLYCYDFQGKLLWKRDLSSIDSSFAIEQQYEWGFGSSPLIHEGLVILQCDLSKDSFVAAYSLEDGARVWSTPRDEIPSWSSPVVWRNGSRTELVTNASQYARGYDPVTGKELWRLAKKSEATIPMPVIGRELLYITSGNRPIQPIVAIRPGAVGDISLPPNEDRNAHIVWSKMRGGPYMTTPIVYGQYLYVCSNAGILTCYQADSGKDIYKERLGGVSYTASPVAADGRLYFTSEQGAVRVAKAGPEFQLLAVNELGDVCMATPAISAGTLFVRSQHFLFALGRKPEKKWFFVDLQPKANHKLVDDVQEGTGGNDLKEVKTGEQTLADVRFKIGDKYIQLGGTNSPAKPGKVTGIKVDHRAAKLHLLHATEWTAEDDTIIGEYTVTFDDDTSTSIPLRYGKDVLDWWYDEWLRRGERGQGCLARRQRLGQRPEQENSTLPGDLGESQAGP